MHDTIARMVLRVDTYQQHILTLLKSKVISLTGIKMLILQVVRSEAIKNAVFILIPSADALSNRGLATQIENYVVEFVWQGRAHLYCKLLFKMGNV